MTGASSGIGLELLKILSKEKAKVVAVGLEDFEHSLENVFYLKKDISSKEAVDEVFSFANKKIGDVDIYIANAGFAYYQSAHNATTNQVEEIFKVNTFSPIYAYNKLKIIKKDKSFQFVTTASAMSYMPLAGYALYSATKAGQKAFFDAARFELKRNQHISIIYPITTKTNFFKKNVEIPFPYHTAQSVAKKYYKGIVKNKKSIYPSKLFQLDKHLHLVIPFIQKREKKRFLNYQKQERNSR